MNWIFLVMLLVGDGAESKLVVVDAGPSAASCQAVAQWHELYVGERIVRNALSPSCQRVTPAPIGTSGEYIDSNSTFSGRW